MRFEYIEVWKRSKNLAVNTYRATKNLKDYGFRDQITRSCLSISSNIAEGLERKGDKEKCQFLSIAKGSLAEFKSQTLIGYEIGYIEEPFASTWLKESEEIAAMLSSFLKKLHSESN